MKKYLLLFVYSFMIVSLTGYICLAGEGQQNDAESVVSEHPFLADGIISEGEYENQATYQNLEIFWSNDREYIYMALKGKTQGYISIGIQPGAMMRDSDIILSYIKDEKVKIFDQYSTGDFGPHPSDEDLGGTNDILEFAGKETEGFTIIEFKRLLKTEDQYDLELKPGKNKIIWAYSNQDNLQAKHANRGYGEIVINTSED